MTKDKPDVSLDKTRQAIFSGKTESESVAQNNNYNSIKQSQPYPFLNPSSGNNSLGLIGHYEILNILGEGGMGFVFKAEDLQLHRTVALKVMKPILTSQGNARERFLHEARSMASIHSDNVAIIHQVGEQHDVPYLAMEFLKGQSMDQWIKSTDITAVETILKWAIEICNGLIPAHEQNLIHRDIKPANLWIEAPDNRIKILDFGLAYAMESDTKLTQTGHIIGTLEYMAPEQFESSKANAKTDLFSLGCVLYQLASKASPFSGTSQLSVIKKIATATPKPLQNLRPDIPYSLSLLISQLLSKNPDKRPASAKEVGIRLKQIRQQFESDNSQHQHPSQVSNQGKRALHASGVSNISQAKPGNSRFLFRFLVLALIIGGYFFYQSNSSEEDRPAAQPTSANIPLPEPHGNVDDDQYPGNPLPAESFENYDSSEEDGFENDPGFIPDEALDAEPGSSAADESVNKPYVDRAQTPVGPGFNPDNTQGMPPPPPAGFPPPHMRGEGMYPPPPGGFPPPRGFPPQFRPPPQ